MPDNSPKQPTPPVVHDNNHLVPYLKEIHVWGSDFVKTGMPIEHADKWPDAKKIRQTMYIAGLAKKIDGRLHLTDAGREYIKGK